MSFVVSFVVASFFIIFPFESTLSSERMKAGIADKASPQAVNLTDWGIDNGCISSNYIRKIKVIDEHSALLLLVDGRRIKLHFKNTCPGAKQYGFVYTARNNLFCTHSYSVRVLHTGAHCQVASFEPFPVN